jgi:hypothetical protein
MSESSTKFTVEDTAQVKNKSIAQHSSKYKWSVFCSTVHQLMTPLGLGIDAVAVYCHARVMASQSASV